MSFYLQKKRKLATPFLSVFSIVLSSPYFVMNLKFQWAVLCLYVRKVSLCAFLPSLMPAMSSLQ